MMTVKGERGASVRNSFMENPANPKNHTNHETCADNAKTPMLRVQARHRVGAAVSTKEKKEY
jgi:hypothetical protein